MKNKSSEIPKKKCRRTLRLSISLSSLANLAMWSLGRHRNRALEIQRPLVFRRILLRPLWDDRVLAYVSHEQQSWRYMAISYIYIILYIILYDGYFWVVSILRTENIFASLRVEFSLAGHLAIDKESRLMVLSW